MVARDRIHRFVDDLPTEDLEALGRFLERLDAEEDPLERALLRASLLEPVSLSSEEEQLLREAEEDVAAGRLVSHEDIRREFLEES